MNMRFITILILFSTTLLFSQGIINQSADIVVNGAASIVIDGNGNWTNNGTVDAGTGTVHFVGNANQTIQGSSTTGFYNLTINKSAGDALVAVNTGVSNNLTMTSGDLDLQNSTVSLGGSGTIVSETEANRIKVGTPASDIGTITSTQTVNNVSNFDPANLGVEITTTANLNTITIVRGHLIQTGSFNSGGTATSGVERYYEIPGIGQLDAGESLVLHYWDAELNGLTEAQLEGYHWVTEGSSSSWWTPLDGTENTSSNEFTTAANPYDSYFTTSTWYGFTWSDKFTLGSSTTPLPVVLTNLNTKCNDNGAEIEWTTKSEINNDYFTIEKSIDGYSFKNIGEVDGAGNSNEINNYNYYDSYNYGQTYYKISQTDFDGTTKAFKIVSANCINSNNADNIILYPNPAINNTTIKIDGENNFTSVIITDILGKQIKELSVLGNENIININTINLSEGVYNVILKSNNGQVIKQLIITK